MRRFPDHVPAGEISAALDIRPSTLSSYLASLMQAGLVTQKREGTWLRYQVDMAATRSTLDSLYLDCCRGRADLCWPDRANAPQETRPLAEAFNVLFICSGNSARSIFAESLLRDLGGDRFSVHSAGTNPSSELNPFAVDVLKSKGHDVTLLRAKNVQEYTAAGAPAFDFVFTVCDAAANEDCPAWEGQPVSGHWGLPDPVKAEGTNAERSLAFQHAYGILRNRIAAFAALPIDELDRISLQHAVDAIAQNDLIRKQQ
jgi:protein-tyrosine-phosphatase